MVEDMWSDTMEKMTSGVSPKQEPGGCIRMFGPTGARSNNRNRKEAGGSVCNNCLNINLRTIGHINQCRRNSSNRDHLYSAWGDIEIRHGSDRCHGGWNLREGRPPFFESDTATLGRGRDTPPRLLGKRTVPDQSGCRCLFYFIHFDMAHMWLKRQTASNWISHGSGASVRCLDLKAIPRVKPKLGGALLG